MRVIEQRVAPKTGRSEDCEDALLHTEHFAAVVDGCTRPPHPRWQGRRPGQIALGLIRETLEALPATLDMPAAVAELTRCLFAYYQSLGIEQILQNAPAERPAATLAVFSAKRREVWLVGDCQCLLDGELFTQRMKLDEVLGEVRSLVLHLELLSGRTEAELMRDDPGRKFIAPLLAQQPVFQNTFRDSQYAYGVIDGFPVPPQFCRVIPVPPDARQLVLATDGYPILFPTLAESEAYLRELLRGDPLCCRDFKATKSLGPGKQSFDDRAYLRLEL